MSQIPSIISDYYSASDAGDIARLVACFSNRATVVDEIHGWRESPASAFTHTLAITGVESRTWGSTSSARTSRATSRAALITRSAHAEKRTNVRRRDAGSGYLVHHPVNRMVAAANSVAERPSVLSLVTSAGAEASNPRAASRLRRTA